MMGFNGFEDWFFFWLVNVYGKLIGKNFEEERVEVRVEFSRSLFFS